MEVILQKYVNMEDKDNLSAFIIFLTIPLFFIKNN